MAREKLRFQFGKYNGDEHWGMDVEVLGHDEHGLWLAGRKSSELTKPGTTVKATSDYVMLVPADAWWVATFNKQPWGKRRDIEIYVDISTPTTVNEGEAFTLDLDLDVIKRSNGAVEIDDEDEFVEHQQAMGYPAKVVDQARKAADGVKTMIENGTSPFDGVAQGWFAKI